MLYYGVHGLVDWWMKEAGKNQPTSRPFRICQAETQNPVVVVGSVTNFASLECNATMEELLEATLFERCPAGIKELRRAESIKCWHLMLVMMLGRHAEQWPGTS